MINITLAVNTQNIPAQKLYRSCGFQEIGIERGYLFVDGTYMDVLHMQRVVTKENVV